MSARDEIRARARKLGWTIDDRSDWTDIFTIDAERPEMLDKMLKAGGVDWQAQNRIVVQYYGKHAVYEAVLQTPWQQAVLNGNHSGEYTKTEGPGRKQQVLSWLEWGKK